MAKEKSDLSRAFSEDGTLKTHVGGQALIEGIMMRGKYNWAVAVRQPDGDIYIEEHDLASGKDKHKWMGYPFIRGCTALVESLALGFKALEIAAEHAFDDDEEEHQKLEEEANEIVSHLEEQFDDAPVAAMTLSETDAQELCENDALDAPSKSAEYRFEPEDADHSADGAINGSITDDSNHDAASESKSEEKSAKSGEGGLGKAAMTISMVLGVVLGIALFIIVPAVITNFIVGEYDEHTVLWNVVDGILRVIVFIFYIWLIGRMEDIRRMFMYHGAEHKTIHCYEHQLPLTPENARSFPRLHVRCGTAFLIMVMLIAILVYTILPINAFIDALGIPDGLPKLLLVIGVRILFLPLIAGISYEITVKWAGSHPDNPLVKLILWPGMQMQYLTTNEPDDEQLECAIAAMKRVLEREEAAARV